MKERSLLLIAFTLLTAYKLFAQEKTPENDYANDDLKAVIIDAAHQTFGYDILLDGKILIHQPNIPGLPGNDGFKTKTEAEKVANFVISKIRKGEMPPTLSLEELKELKLIK